MSTIKMISMNRCKSARMHLLTIMFMVVRVHLLLRYTMTVLLHLLMRSCMATMPQCLHMARFNIRLYYCYSYIFFVVVILFCSLW